MPALQTILNRSILFLFILLFYRMDGSAASAKGVYKTVEKVVDRSDTIIGNCSKNEFIDKIINDAITIGAPIYNNGFHLACYRVYEWAGYKILYEYGDSCKEVKKILKTAIEKSHGDYSDVEKAWMMRVAFDTILGVPTQTGESEIKPNIQRKG